MNEETLKQQFDATQVDLTLQKARIDHEQRRAEERRRRLKLYPQVAPSHVPLEKQHAALEFLVWYQRRHQPFVMPRLKWYTDATRNDLEWKGKDEFPFEAFEDERNPAGLWCEAECTIWLKADLELEGAFPLIKVLAHEVAHFEGQRDEALADVRAYELLDQFKHDKLLGRTE